MSLINHRAREIHVKIVYYGPGLGGKTTNVRILHERIPAEKRGRLVTIATEQERTLFFDFMPVDLGVVNGFTTRFHLYTVPGQIYYRRSRRAVLQGVDGIVFVADSQADREQDNLESLADLHMLLGHVGLGPAQVARLPRVIQYNKRDVTNLIPLERMRAMLNPDGLPEFEAVAVDGKGVSETMRAIAKGVLGRLTGLAAPAGVSSPSAVPAPAPAPARPVAAAAIAAPAPPPLRLVPAAASVPAAPAQAATPAMPAPPLRPAAVAPAAPTVPAPLSPLLPAVPLRPTSIVPIGPNGTIVPVTPIGPVRPAGPAVPAAAPSAPSSPRSTPFSRRGPFRRPVPTRT